MRRLAGEWFFVRCKCKFRRFTGGKSRNLHAADGGKDRARHAAELGGGAQEKAGDVHTSTTGGRALPTERTSRLRPCQSSAERRKPSSAQSRRFAPPLSRLPSPRAKPPNGLWTRALSMRALPYFSASVSSPNHSGRWKSGRKWTMGAQEPKWGWIVSSHL